MEDYSGTYTIKANYFLLLEKENLRREKVLFKSELQFLDLQKPKKNLKKTEKKEKTKNNAATLIFKKLLRQGEIFLSKMPLKKILPIIKRNENKNFLWIVFFVSKFIKNLKEITFHKKFNKLNHQHFSLINDKARIPESHLFNKKMLERKENFLKKQSCFINFIEKVKFAFLKTIYNFIETIYLIFDNLSKKIPVFEPDRPFRFVYDIFMLFYLVLVISNMALMQGFQLEESDYLFPVWLIFNILPCYVFLFNIILDFNTSYYSKGVYISSRTKIFKHYIKYDLLLDMLTLIPLFLKNTGFVNIEGLFILRVVDIGKMIKRLEEYLQLQGKKEGIFQLIKLMINLIFLAHLCACVWHYLGLWEISNGIYNNWLVIKGIELDKWYIQYIYSFYFSIVTMMTVGYGDISSNNYIESTINIFIIIYGCGVFAYTINNIGNIFKEMNYDDKEFKKKIKIISDYMNKRGINKYLQMKIKKYLEYMYEESKMNYKDCFLLSQTLSQTLREECNNELYGKLLKNQKLFTLYSEDFLSKLTNCFQEATFAPDDLIQNQEENEKFIYFILKGDITVLFHDNKSFQSSASPNMAKIKKGNTFGEVTFVTDEKKTLSAKCLTVTHVAYLKRSEFIKLLQQFPEDYEKFSYFKDKITLDNGHQDLQISCFSCNENDHLISDCPLLHYIPHKRNIISRFLLYEEQNRNKEYKRRIFSYDARRNLAKVQSKSYDILKANVFIDQSEILQESDYSGEGDASPESDINSPDLENELNIELDEQKIKHLRRKNSNILEKTFISSTPKHENEKVNKQYENSFFDKITGMTILEESKDGEDEENDISPLKVNKFRKLFIQTKKKFSDYSAKIRMNRMNDCDNNIKEIKSGTLLKAFDKQNLIITPGLPQANIRRPSIYTKKSSLYEKNKKETSSLQSIEGSKPFIDSKDSENLVKTLENFDKMKNYKFYFVTNNYDIVLKKMKRKQLLKKKRATLPSVLSQRASCQKIKRTKANN